MHRLLYHRFTVLSMIFACLGGVSGCDLRPESVAKQNAPRKATPVKTVVLQQQEVRRTTTQPATVAAFQQAEIRARVAGYVAALHVDIGDVVQEGDSLVTIAVPELDMQRAMLQAQLARREAQQEQAKSGITLAEAVVQSAKAKLQQSRSDVDQAEAALQAAEAEYKRTEDLVSRRSLESRLLDEARERRDAARAGKRSAESAIRSAEAEVAVAEAKLAAAQADLTAAKADTQIAERELEEIEVRIGFAKLPAPFDGVVTMRAVDVGDLVNDDDNTKSRPLFVLSSIDKLRIQVPVPEADTAWVNRGDSISMSFPTFPGETLEAEVKRVASALDSETRTMLVEAEISNPDGKLMPGMFGTASITLETNSDVAVLPARAVRFDELGNAFVYVVTDDQTVSIAEVTTGADDGSQIEIRSGLQPRQEVIDAHLARFVDGQPVSLLSP